jgi:hypothetical protein
MAFEMGKDDMFPPLLDDQQFTAADVLQVTGLSAGQLKGILDRHQITLSENHNPGTGRRRMFTGQDLIALSAVQAASRIGFPLRWGNVLAQQVVGFANRMHMEKKCGVKTPHLALAFYPADDGEDWAFVPIYDGDETISLPTAFQVLDVTREVDQTLAKLQAIVDDIPVPEFNPPKPPPAQNQYAPSSNFFKMWTKDEAGNWLLVGLNLEETREFMAARGMKLVGDELEYFQADNHRFDRSHAARMIALQDKHDEARFIAMNEVDG